MQSYGTLSQFLDMGLVILDAIDIFFFLGFKFSPLICLFGFQIWSFNLSVCVNFEFNLIIRFNFFNSACD